MVFVYFPNHHRKVLPPPPVLFNDVFPVRGVPTTDSAPLQSHAPPPRQRCPRATPLAGPPPETLTASRSSSLGAEGGGGPRRRLPRLSFDPLGPPPVVPAPTGASPGSHPLGGHYSLGPAF